MKELELEFIGRGQVRGFKFTQIKKSQYAYLYSVQINERTIYEVFFRKENDRYNCVSYPSNKAFGIWAWTFKTLEQSEQRFEELNIRKESK